MRVTYKVKNNQEDLIFFERTPFNFCDRWCERCDQGERCRVFQDETETRHKHIIKGEDPDSIEIVFKDMAEIFKKTLKLLKEDAERMRFDLEKINEEPGDLEPKPQDFPFCRVAGQFRRGSHKLLEKIFEEQEKAPKDFEDVQNAIEELSWYHTLVEAKLYRALCGKWRKAMEDGELMSEIEINDALVSAKLCFASLSACESALRKIGEARLCFSKWVKDLLIISAFLKERVETEFPQMQKARIIFHG